MSRTGAVNLDYFDLLGAGDPEAVLEGGRPVRVALLADCAPQQIATMLRAVYRSRGFEAEIYEADYDTIELEALRTDSGLYQFRPEAIILINATQTLRGRFYSRNLAQANFVEDTYQSLRRVWQALLQNTKATIIQSNFAPPEERFYGNLDQQVAGSFYHCVRQLNARLSEFAADTESFLINDVDYLASFHGLKHWYSPKLWVLAKTPCSLELLPFLAKNITDIHLSALGQQVKCVICDLDNTLWGGIIGDDGLENIALGHLGEGEAFHELQHYVLELKRRGLLLTVCSKNDEANALLPFREHPETVLRETDFAAFTANWQHKNENIARQQKTLNIGLDSMVFLDDNPFERNLVRESLTDVIVPELPEDPSEYVRHINELNLFETTAISEEDLQRTEMYRAQSQRTELEQQFEGIDDYLRSLEMRITVARFDEFHLPRIVQLLQRSNQFNLTTRRHNAAECTALMKRNDCLPVYVKLADKFGDYGLIAVIILVPNEANLEVDTWLMSCRVLSRGVEQYCMNHVVEAAGQMGAARLIGRYLPTKKNGMVREFFAQFGFAKTTESPEETVWELNLADYQPRPTFVEPTKPD